MNLKRTLFLLAAVLPLQLSAKVTLPAIFTDNMVLQQQSDVKIWGRAKPGKAVKVTTSWDGKTYAATASATGGWEVRVSTPVAGGPYTVTVSDGKPVELKNVLIGEVWLCSGQSNMEMRVADRVLNYEQEMKEADAYGNIRLLHIDNTTSPVPLDEASVRHGGWQVCSGENIADFSATGYFFGKELYKNLGIPIGLIESCWGGTYAESWTSAEALSEMPYFRPRVEKVKQIPESREARNRMFHDDMDEWRLRMMQADKAFEDGRAVWAESSFDDSSWGEIAVPGFVQDQGLDGFSGFMWVRRDVEIPAGWAGKELTLTLAAIDDNDFTYFNGVEVGHTEGCMAFRSYKIPASLVKAGKATVAVGGKEALAVGKNTRTVTVTAQNGTQKTYTIVITRMAEGEKTGEESKPEDNTASTDNSAVIDGVKYSIATDLSGFKLPNGFKATTASRGGAEVAVAQDTDANYTIYYLKGENSESYLPYILEADGETFKKLKYATFGNNTYIFADIPEDKSIPDGFYPSSVKIGDFDITAYKSPDESLSDFYYTYCFFDKGFGFYRYDSAEGVLQRSPEFKLTDTNAEEPKSGGFISRFGSLSSNAKIIVIGIAVLIIGAVMLVIMLIRRVVKLGDYSDDDAYDRDMFTGGFDSVTVEDGSTGTEEEENTEKITK